MPPARVVPAASGFAAAPAAAALSVDQIIDKYVAPLGGADAIRKITSRIMKGCIVQGGVHSFERGRHVQGLLKSNLETCHRNPDRFGIARLHPRLDWAIREAATAAGL